jgi:hypothetical protein
MRKEIENSKNVSDTIRKKGNDVLYSDSQTPSFRTGVEGAGIDSRVDVGLSVSGVQNVVYKDRVSRFIPQERSVISREQRQHHEQDCLAEFCSRTLSERLITPWQC